MMMILKSLDTYVNSKLFDQKLSMRRPTFTTSMKDYSWLVVGVQNINSRGIQPNQMGTAIGIMAGLFSRFRIIKAIFTYVPYSGTTPGFITMGVADDNGAEGGSTPQPVNATEVLDCRSSTQIQVGNGGELVWTPLDPEKKYYTYTTGSSGDQRDSIPGTFYVFADANTVNLQITLRVTIEFSGQVSDATA